MRKICAYSPEAAVAYTQQLCFSAEMLIILAAALPIVAVCLLAVLALVVGGLIGSLLRYLSVVALRLACWCGLLSPGDVRGEVNPAR